MFERKDSNQKKQNQPTDANRDPITGSPGSHPVGTGVGAAAGGAAGVAGGAAAGAATGTAMGGPIGAAAGAVVGGIAGAAVGHSAAEHYDPTEDDAYWREHHSNQPYYSKQYSYGDYQGAYRTGAQGFARFRNSGRSYDECEAELRNDYQRNYSNSRVNWEQARPAVRAGWDRHDRHLERYMDYDVVDRNDSKIGSLHCIWSDHTGEPAFVGVRTGWLMGKTHVVPAESVQVSEFGRRLRLPYDEQKVKDAPSYDADIEMSEEKEREVYNYYGLASRRFEQASTQRTTQTRPPTPSQATPEQATIQLSEEQLKVGKREVEVGGVRLRKIVRTEVVNQPVELKREEIVIERVPADQAHTGRQKAFSEQEVYIPLRREEAVIQKETHLREEVRARKATETDRQEIKEQVRKEDIEIEQSGETRRKTGPRGTPAENIREREEQPRSMRRHNG